MPNVPGRRKKVEEGGGAQTGAETAASNEAFKDLIKAAGSEAGWGRGRGRGRGRGQLKYQVTFGGVEEREYITPRHTTPLATMFEAAVYATPRHWQPCLRQQCMPHHATGNHV